MRNFSPEPSNLAESAVVYSATLAAVVLSGLILAYWTWMWLAPRPEPRVQSAAELDAHLSSAYRLFGTVQRDANAVASTDSAIKLLGVVAASRNLITES